MLQALQLKNLTFVQRAALVILALTVFAYGSSLSVPFHFDDSHAISDNLAMRSLKNIPQFWTDSLTSSVIPENRTYRPLTYSLHAIAWSIGGGETWPFHVFKILLHFGVAFSLFLIWRILWSYPGWFPKNPLTIGPNKKYSFKLTGENAAFLIGAIFAFHPATSECAIYISATNSLLCTFLYVVAFYFYLVFRKSKVHHHLFLALVFYGLSFFAKEEGITLAGMVFAAEAFFLLHERKKRSWLQILNRATLTAIPYVLTAVGLLLFWRWIYPPTAFESHGYITPWNYFFTQWRAYLWYMKIWFWPFGLNADNLVFEFSKSFWDTQVIQALIGNLALLAFALIHRKHHPSFLFGLLWFYITITPASSIVPLAEPVNERRMYLSYIGFVGGSFSVMIWFFSLWLKPWRAPWPRRILTSLLVVVSVGLWVGTYKRNLVWQTGESLWRDTVEKNPTSGRAMNNLALALSARPAAHAEALRLLAECERVWPRYDYCPINRAMIYIRQNRHDEAERALWKAHKLRPHGTFANLHLGEFYEHYKKDTAKSYNHYTQVNELSGGRNVKALLGLARLEIVGRNHQAAHQKLQAILSQEPGNTDANKLLKQLGDRQPAQQH